MTETAAVRILVAQPAVAQGSAQGSDLGTLDALRRLGAEAELEVVNDAASCCARAETGQADLVVLDQRLGAEAEQILAALCDVGPPVVMVVSEGGEQAVRDAFQRGAKDCVVAGSAYAEALPVAALEQLRLWRASRQQVRANLLERRIDDLERYTENIIQNMNSALLVVDAEGMITFANPTAERILAPDRHGLRGRLVWEWFADTPREELHLARTLREGIRFRGAEALVTRPDGRVPIGISCAPLRDGAGGASGAVAIFQDLTEIKQLQRQVLHKEKMASIGQLAAGVAHEINNPMGFIHANLVQLLEYVDDLKRVFGQVQQLCEVLRGGSPVGIAAAAGALGALLQEVDAEYLLDDFGKAVRESLDGAERIRGIVHDLRAFSHEGHDKDVDADLNECLDSTASIAWTMMKHSVVLTKEYGELPRVKCSPPRLQQVFMNLLLNAYQAIEARGPAYAGRGEIRLRTEVRDLQVVVSVRDNGVGIPPEHLDRIFDPFFTTKQVGEGMGLGLSTSFNIVRRHGGTLRVESAPGGGSLFEVVLPQSGCS